ncbi:3-hydroxy-9,10-secoandrosta-1,3,5(10)-triene-9,17-dione monooxygenase reductase subunit [Paractinoplanes rishiriensis]|uniref:3-hydroxy-9,10-secoandrosta-1,3,5(10)-triene-9, 17-dione monooxygenase reductase subunit n=1 Tax=Paractinoplanes rishiriensis TaxID=1050105 RepID=UPI001EF3C69F|nr:3-hydroxy-9,10-secoandrosta-1,3,5(10)-triene-9,17-dione monooxygenase reductase subunit [Actinoplanes rishiriensis]
MAAAPVGFDTRRFRRVFGHFCTGVTVITTADAAGPAGFACQSFTPLSLDPPLVLFCPQQTSATWQRIRSAGVFCVNILADEHRDVSRTFGTSGPDKFAGLAWRPAPSGAPILPDALTWADCQITEIHPGGDHDIVVGRVTSLGECRDAGPLLFYRGRYTGTAPVSPHEVPEVVDTLLAWPRHTDWI